MDDYQSIANGVTNQILLAVSSSLSILGCTLIITTYICYKDIRTVSRHLVICISIADFIVATSNCMALSIAPEVDSTVDETDHITCAVQSFIGTTAVLWSFLWTMMLAVYLYLDLVKGAQAFGKKIIWPWAHLFCWLLPLAINLTAVFLNKLGNAGDRNTSGWCWISVFVDNYSDAKLWMFVDGKAIELLTYAVIIVLYFRMKCVLRRKIPYDSNDESSTHLLQRHALDAARYTDRKITLIPILFILLRIWGTIRFFMLLRSRTLTFSKRINKFEETILYLQTIGDNLQGAVNCILFCCMTPVVRKRINQSMSNLRKERFHLYDNLDTTSDTSSQQYQSIE